MPSDSSIQPPHIYPGSGTVKPSYWVVWQHQDDPSPGPGKEMSHIKHSPVKSGFGNASFSNILLVCTPHQLHMRMTKAKFAFEIYEKWVNSLANWKCCRTILKGIIEVVEHYIECIT